ncbi:MAG: pantetheine-phosphate adenylyltransferase [Flavobacteriales bacterium]|nr:pantetheine-phosphate adenylyltransferase [Flavobacteriales bacterium]
MKNKKAIFPGSFDPITFGHIDIINQSLELFETIVIGIGINESKKHMFDIDHRKDFITSIFEKDPRILIKKYSGLTIDFCQQEKAHYIIRGIRNTADLEYEKTISLANQQLNKNVNTIFFPAKKEHTFISSTIVREIILNQRDLMQHLKHFVPSIIIKKIEQQFM